MDQQKYHIQACINAWLKCENVLVQLANKQKSFANKTMQVLDECAQICLGTLHAIKSSFYNVNKIALLCVGICEECAETCERYNDPLFAECAAACRECSSAITSLAKSSV